jgi:hypothetical protein
MIAMEGDHGEIALPNSGGIKAMPPLFLRAQRRPV